MPKKKFTSARGSQPIPLASRYDVLLTDDDFPALDAPASPPPPQPSTSRQSAPVAAPIPPIIPQTAPTFAEPIAGPSGQSAAETEASVTKSSASELPKDLAQELEENLMITAVKRDQRPFPKRPNLLVGNSVSLITNHFLVTVGQKLVYHYDIEIERAFKRTTDDTNVVDKEVEEETPVVRKKANKFSRKIGTNLNRKIFNQMIDNYSQTREQCFYAIDAIYDGQKNMFTSNLLNVNQIRLLVGLTEFERVSEFYVNIKLAETGGVIDLDVLNQYNAGIICDDEVVKKSILFINTLLRHNLANNMISIGQSIFNPLKKPDGVLSPSLDLSYGIYTSVRNLMVGQTLNVDRSAAAFIKPLPIKDIIDLIIRGDLSLVPRLSRRDMTIIRKELSGIQIEATHMAYQGSTGQHYRKYRVVGLSDKSAKEEKFEWTESGKETKTVSVQQYLLEKYGRTLRFPHLPCLKVGNPSKPSLLPLEVCKIVSHQRVKRSLTNTERSEMTRISGQQNPKERFQLVNDFVTDQFHSNDTNKKFLSAFSIDISKELLTVESKIIPAPRIKYMGDRSVNPSDGEWEMFKDRVKFYKPMSLEYWIIINISFTESFNEQIDAFSADLCSQATEMGMTATPHRQKPQIPAKNFNVVSAFNIIKQRIAALNFPLKMILFITPLKTHPNSDEIYSQIKLLGDIQSKNGLTTQCVNIGKLWDPRNRDPNRRRKWNRSYLRQLMLKVNVKLGGINQALVDSPAMPSIFKKKSLMIVGADVNHPAATDLTSPSISAIVGIYDNDFGKYYTSIKLQPNSREEMIKPLDVMFFEMLTNYRKVKKTLPQHIIFYRDGVSEGQFQHVIDNEYPLIIEAYSCIDPKIKPKITFIVVQKRHHTRFMTKTGRNISPGTVVDTKVTHKTDFDFYLGSHAGRIGTSRPAHYYVLADDNGFTAEDMCKMTYNLCHIYQRCTKSVSIPAPVYYAHLAAYRAKIHVSTQQDVSETSSVVSSDGEGDVGGSNYRDLNTMLNKMTDIQKQKLYFC